MIHCTLEKSEQNSLNASKIMTLQRWRFLLTQIAKAIADIAGKTFSGKIKSREDLEQEVESLIDELRREDCIQRIRIRWTPLKMAVEEALTDCSDNVVPDNSTRVTDDKIIRTDLYTLPGEGLELVDVLDYILVDWPVPLEHMIRSQPSRVIMRKYAEIGQMILECAFDYDYFRVSLRALWTRRARSYFDGRKILLPYIGHRYTRNNMTHSVI